MTNTTGQPQSKMHWPEEEPVLEPVPTKKRSRKALAWTAIGAGAALVAGGVGVGAAINATSGVGGEQPFDISELYLKEMPTYKLTDSQI